MHATANDPPTYWSDHFTRLSLESEKTTESQLEFSNQAVAVQTYSFMLEACGQLGGRRVLDCGFGTGELARMCALLGADVDAFDLVGTRIPRLNAESTGVRWATADLGTWELPAVQPQYDVVLACEVMQYVDFDAVVANLTNALTNTGRLIIVIPNADCEIVQRSAERFDNRYVGISIESLVKRCAKYLPKFQITYRGVRFQQDQSVVPYAADSWKSVAAEQECSLSHGRLQDGSTRNFQLPPNRLQIVFSR